MAAPCAGAAMGKCPAGMPSLKREKSGGPGAGGNPKTLSDRPWEKGRGGERGAGDVIRESPWAVLVFPTSALPALFPGYLALKVIREEKG